MRHFFALPAVLRATAILALASQQPFSVNDDILAFPQYEILLEEDWILEEDAQARLLSKPGEVPVSSTHRQQDAVNEYHGGHAAGGDESEGAGPTGAGPVEYEYMVMGGQRWLCTVPLVNEPEHAESVNQTRSRAEEEKELARATDRGWELLSGMENNCVYFVSGWWSYRFCYNQGVKQFHQLPPSRSVAPYPPEEDTSVEGYVLGKYRKGASNDDDARATSKGWNGGSTLGKNDGAKWKSSGAGELIQRGESRYLVQHLDGGTICDLTGKERNIEVQFHCNPQTTDKISLIKETATCTYLMVIHTPRLCHDVAFLPPQKDQPNAVLCSPVLNKDEVERYEEDLAALKSAERDAKLREARAELAAVLSGPGADQLPAPVLVGDIYVGAHAIIPEDQKIEKSVIVGGGKETYLATVAGSDGHRLSKAEMDRLGLGDVKAVEMLVKELEKRAEGKAWKLVAVDTARGREYRHILIDDDDESAAPRKEGQARKAGKQDKGATEGKGGAKTAGEPKANKDAGSEEEFFRDEL